jgi:hypothetical protein
MLETMVEIHPLQIYCDKYIVFQSLPIDCENMEPETDFSASGLVPDSYQPVTSCDDFNFSDNYDNDDLFYNDELSFTLSQECELQSQVGVIKVILKFVMISVSAYCMKYSLYVFIIM